MSAETYKYGLLAEQIACNFLHLKGYKILHKRYKGFYGDIDIICLNEQTIIFIEVKATKTKEIPIISEKKIKKNCVVASHFINSFYRYSEFDYRFDYIIVQNNKVIHHQEYAWDWIECNIW